MIPISFPGPVKRINAEQVADALAMAVVISLPWSTSLTASLIGLWLLSTLPFLRPPRLQKSLSSLRKSLTAPAGALPVWLWLIAVLGMLWADISWLERLRGLAGFHKLLVIPLLLVQFRRPAQAHYVLVGFLFSCTVLLIFSWGSVLWPAVERTGHCQMIVGPTMQHVEIGCALLDETNDLGIHDRTGKDAPAHRGHVVDSHRASARALPSVRMHCSITEQHIVLKATNDAKI